MARCHYSGLFVLSCKVSDLCDCFDYPEVEARVAEILARRDAATERPTPADPAACELPGRETSETTETGSAA